MLGRPFGLMSSGGVVCRVGPLSFFSVSDHVPSFTSRSDLTRLKCCFSCSLEGFVPHSAAPMRAVSRALPGGET
jgi:hypothetical protein